ncbi:hypothetical protein BH23BAC1_BH23BAC1_26160 [soil metagenome]
MNIISSNIKYLRKQYQLTQSQFAEKIGIKRSLVGAYEEGRADPRLNNLLKISNIFNVSVDDLLRKDLSKSPNLPGQVADSVKVPSPLKILSITVDQEGKENIELVPQKAAAGYMNGYSDPEYLEQLPRFQLPVLPATGTYRAFEISGDSMLPLQSGTIIIGRYVEDFHNLNSTSTYVLVTLKEGVVYKRIASKIEENGTLLLISDNKIYSPYEISLDEIMEIWEAKAYISLTFPGADTGEMTIEKLKNIVLELQQEVIKLKS